MRHLSVPSQQTETWLLRCRREGWLADAGVARLEDDRRGIPLNSNAPPEDDAVWGDLPCVDIEPNAKGPTHWRERLPASLQALDDAIWPSAYEIQGDVLMVKVEGEAATHEQAMADAMLAQLPNTRLICADEGVEGDFRVRNLRVLASRDGSTTTRTTVKEHGSTIWVDPGEVYFSARLSTQRQETHQQVKSFREQLGKPLVLADPYAGVGPSLPLLINDEGLLSGYIVGDLNPVAVDLLRMNLDAWTRGKDATLSPATAVCQDARSWKSVLEYCGQADVLLVNLPHDSFEHLPDLFPLFNRTNPSLLRGWAIVERASLPQRNQHLRTLVRDAGGTPSGTFVEEVKGFSSTRCFVVFQATIAWD